MVDVSVCLITYKHEKYIAQALDSILMQKVDFTWEIIIADDCSPDITQDIILKYYEKYPDLIKLFFQKENVGPGKNFVNLLSSANGKYIAYLEGDDYWTDPLKLQTQFDFMESNPDFSLCYHKINWFYMYKPADLTNMPLESNINDQEEYNVYDIIKFGWFIRTCSMFFKNINLPKDFEKLFIGDYPLHILLADTGKVGFINKCMGTYRIHSEGLSETILLVKDMKQRYENYKGEIFLLNYLNKETCYKYDSYFKVKVFEVIYSFNHFLLCNNKLRFITNLFSTFRYFNLFFLIKHLSIKILNKLKLLLKQIK
jgi:glycosyltransferase involved in cell wall biosynthesis